ncbi:MAG: phosphate transport system substrate-binding protein [Solirubrobacterales bacterium]|jgi:phosphate transport system substrate-binding protein|nr:phosphate transport system substrate-binding protein [Solirubrobacterales bacterium]
MRSKTLAIAALSLMGLAAPASAGAVTLIGSGSVAAQPVLQALFATYTKKVNKKVHFVYTANGGNAGVKDVQNGTSQFAGQARTPLPSDAGTTYIKMFLDGLCMDVNPKNSLTNITIQQTHDIYRGLITNWSQVPGSTLGTTIDPVGRDTNGGTYNFFLQAVLGNEPPASNVNALTADGLVVNAVKQDPNAIGYAGLAWQKKGLKPLKVNGVPCAPSKISVEPLKYPLSRYLFLVLPGDGSSSPKALLKFVDWARRSKLAGTIISKAGGVPAFNKK